MSRIGNVFVALTNALSSPGSLGTAAGLAVAGAVFAPAVLTAILSGLAVLAAVAVTSAVVRGIRNGADRIRFMGNTSSKDRQQRSRKKKTENGQSASKKTGRVVDTDVVFDRVRGKWNISALPLDMKPTADYDGSYNLNGRVKKFDVGNMRGVVEGRAGINGMPKFSFKVAGMDAAVRLSDIISQSDNPLLKTVTIKHSTDGGYVCSSANPAAICTLFRKAQLTSKEAEVKLEVKSVNQYMVTGCRNEEEARRKLVEMKEKNELDGLKLVNAYETVSTSMDGKDLNTRINGKSYEPASLEVGTFIIDDVYVSTTMLKSDVAGGEIMDNGRLAENVLSDPNAVSTKLDAKCEVSIDGCNDCQRFVTLSRGDSLSLDQMNRLADKTVKEFYDDDMSKHHYLRFEVCSPDELKSILQSGSITGKRVFTLVSNGEGSMKEKPGTICIPVDNKMLKTLSPVGYRGDDFYDYVRAGINEDTLKMAYLGESLKFLDGKALVFKSEDIGLNQMVVNGVNGRELAQRLNDSNAYEFKTLEHMRLWANEASRIEDVDVKIDYKKSELVIKSTVFNGSSSSTKIESRTLSNEEMSALSDRLPLTATQGKDLLMLCHPEYFKTYRGSDGKSMFVNPLDDFINGRKPETPVQRMNRQKQQKGILGNVLGGTKKVTGAKSVKPVPRGLKK